MFRDTLNVNDAIPYAAVLDGIKGEKKRKTANPGILFLSLLSGHRDANLSVPPHLPHDRLTSLKP
jgi:hypothetical protein